ncbi:fumarylacetoacetate hydrolase family protein [Endozoicomonas sp. G2_1]|uniref:fumarylacetoacetate hydrolase family protein n=1 Tax=Endozoicomonas sp. G2_1 TaxID=2821091 RepID=UPI001ADB7E7F|nr:fumarylacetoacetate hydrolase family protein [Endozoicomonas sp. G2_1]MBO9489494.1 fumarylacetoacetate hydrolase family protein [Endozoicomonas sp. G2_1]
MHNTINFLGRLYYPSKVVCVGRNYVEHIKELNNQVPEQPVIFIKPNSSISDVLNSFHQEPLHYEGELAFLYLEGRFAAVAFGLDLTKRALQSELKSKGLPWERAKSFNESALFSDFVSFDDISALSLSLDVNGETRQQGGVDLMLCCPEALLTDISSFIDLVDGDIVMTGTPAGVGVVDARTYYVGKVLENDKVLIEKTWLSN